MRKPQPVENVVEYFAMKKAEEAAKDRPDQEWAIIAAPGAASNFLTLVMRKHGFPTQHDIARNNFSVCGFIYTSGLPDLTEKGFRVMHFVRDPLMNISSATPVCEMDAVRRWCINNIEGYNQESTNLRVAMHVYVALNLYGRKSTRHLFQIEEFGQYSNTQYIEFCELLGVKPDYHMLQTIRTDTNTRRKDKRYRRMFWQDLLVEDPALAKKVFAVSEICGYNHQYDWEAANQDLARRQER